MWEYYGHCDICGRRLDEEPYDLDNLDLCEECYEDETFFEDEDW